MIANTVLTLSALVGNIVYVNYVPKSHAAEICVNSTLSNVKTEYCEIMKIAYLNGSTMWAHQLDDVIMHSTSYFKINYSYTNKTVISSKWRVLTQQNELHCNNFINLLITISCFTVIVSMYLYILYFLWKINAFLR